MHPKTILLDSMRPRKAKHLDTCSLIELIHAKLRELIPFSSSPDGAAAFPGSQQFRQLVFEEIISLLLSLKELARGKLVKNIQIPLFHPTQL